MAFLEKAASLINERMILSPVHQNEITRVVQKWDREIDSQTIWDTLFRQRQREQQDPQFLPDL